MPLLTALPIASPRPSPPTGRVGSGRETTGRNMRRPLLLTLLVVAAATWATTPAAAADPEAEVQAILAGAALGDTTAAVMVIDLRTGQTLVDINADQAMVPASNMKLLTTAAALTRLGPDFRFTTRLVLVDPPSSQLPPHHQPSGDPPADENATGEGSNQLTPDNDNTPLPSPPLPSLLIRGGGDPAFGDPALLAQAGLYLDDLLDLWVQAVVDTGHTRFQTLLLDDRIFDQETVHPDWPLAQLHRYSYAQVAGINFYENLLAVLPVPADSPGQAPVVQTEPWFPGLRTTNRATTGAVDDFDIQRPPQTNRFLFLGSVRNRRSEPYRVTVDDPPVFFAEFFQYKLRQAGVDVARIRRVEPQAPREAPGQRVIHEVNTTLAGVIDRTNRDSQNLFAEALLKRMGHELTGSPGGFANGASAVRLFLRDRLADRVGLAAVRVADGSGLSPDNRLTARVLGVLLSQMHDDETLGPIFAASLAHAGHTGTLRNRLRGLTSQVYAKSGYLGASADYASALSGYLVRPDGRAYAFSMIFNGFHAPVDHARIRAVQDQILTSLDASINQPAER